MDSKRIARKRAICGDDACRLVKIAHGAKTDDAEGLDVCDRCRPGRGRLDAGRYAGVFAISSGLVDEWPADRDSAANRLASPSTIHGSAGRYEKNRVSNVLALMM